MLNWTIEKLGYEKKKTTTQRISEGIYKAFNSLTSTSPKKRSNIPLFAVVFSIILLLVAYYSLRCVTEQVEKPEIKAVSSVTTNRVVQKKKINRNIYAPRREITLYNVPPSQLENVMDLVVRGNSREIKN